jgi:hypothetical protein
VAGRYTRVSAAQRPHGTCAVGRTAWASTVPFQDGPRTLPPRVTVRTLAPGDALVAVTAFRDDCRGEPGGRPRARPPALRLSAARRQDWPGRLPGDPPLLRITTTAPGRYGVDVWVFARGAAGRPAARRMLRSIRWPARLG